MLLIIRFILLTALTLFIPNQSIADSFTIPNTFQAGTPAVAAEVNENFSAIKYLVDDNYERIDSLEDSIINNYEHIDSLEDSIIDIINFVNISPSTNTVLGQKALFRNTTGIQNTAVGFNALYENRSGESNVAIGMSSLYFNTVGLGNVGIGVLALRNNTIGNYNVAIGTDALQKNTDGSYNTAINYDALHNNTTGDGNTSVGFLSLYSNTNGSGNVAIGFGAGGQTDDNANVSGSQNTWIGYQAGPGTPIQLNNSIAIGYHAKNTESNQVVLGDENIKSTILRGAVSIGNGTPVASILSSTAFLDFPSTDENAVSDLSIEVEGADFGDVVSIGVPHDSVTETGTYFGWVSTPDEVTIRFSPKSAEDPEVGVFRAVVTKF